MIYGLRDFLIFPKVLHSFEGVVVVGGQQIGKTRFLSLGSDFVFFSVPIVDALTVPNIPQTLKTPKISRGKTHLDIYRN